MCTIKSNRLADLRVCVWWLSCQTPRVRLPSGTQKNEKTKNKTKKNRSTFRERRRPRRTATTAWKPPPRDTPPTSTRAREGRRYFWPTSRFVGYSFLIVFGTCLLFSLVPCDNVERASQMHRAGQGLVYREIERGETTFSENARASCSPRPKQQQQATAVRPSVPPSEMNESKPSHERSSLVTMLCEWRVCIHPALLCSRSSASRAGARVAAGSAIGTVVHLLGQGRVGDEAGRRA